VRVACQSPDQGDTKTTCRIYAVDWFLTILTKSPCMVVFGAILLLSHAAFFPFETIPTPDTVPSRWRGRVSHCIDLL
jgi:hypothetical protein